VRKSVDGGNTGQGSHLRYVGSQAPSARRAAHTPTNAFCALKRRYIPLLGKGLYPAPMLTGYARVSVACVDG